MASPLTKVLIIESDAKGFDELQKIFSGLKNSYQISSVRQLNEGIKLCKKDRPEVVILGLELTDSPASATVSNFSANVPGVPTVVFANEDSELHALRAVQNGAEAYLIKGGLNAQTVLQTLRQAVHYHKIKSEIEPLRKQHEAVLDSITDGVIVLDSKGRVTSLNKAAERITGFGLTELKGKPEHEALHHRRPDSSDYPIEKCPAAVALRSGREQDIEEDFICRRDGTLAPVQIRCIPIAQAGSVAEVLMVFRDTSERQETKRKIAETEEIKSHFISIVSHELRTPITVLKEGIELVSDESLGPLNAEQKDFLKTTLDNVQRLRGTIENLLTFQRFYSDRIEFDFKDGDINNVIESAFDAVKQLAESKQLTIRLNADRKIPAFVFDKGKIEEVLLHLMKNAISYTERGTITVTSGLKENIVEISVNDSGKGIEEKDLARLFSSFGQLEDVNNRRTGGTGLGLVIARKIIEKHQGNMWVKSYKGKGTTFSFALPLRRLDERRSGAA